MGAWGGEIFLFLLLVVGCGAIGVIGDWPRCLCVECMYFAFGVTR